MFRFSIRELMLVTLVVAVSVGWLVDRPTKKRVRLAEWKASALQTAVETLGYAVEENEIGIIVWGETPKPFAVQIAKPE